MHLLFDLTSLIRPGMSSPTLPAVRRHSGTSPKVSHKSSRSGLLFITALFSRLWTWLRTYRLITAGWLLRWFSLTSHVWADRGQSWRARSTLGLVGAGITIAVAFQRIFNQKKYQLIRTQSICWRTEATLQLWRAVPGGLPSWEQRSVGQIQRAGHGNDHYENGQVRFAVN